jgi:hypothetical protein
VQRAAETKISDIDSKLNRLVAVRSALEVFVQSCRNKRARRCPLIEALDAHFQKTLR